MWSLVVCVALAVRARKMPSKKETAFFDDMSLI